MDLSLSPEQQLLRDTVDRLIVDTYRFEQRKAYMRSPAGFSRDNWRRFADLGLLGLPFAESFGGIGGDGVEVMLVMNAFGRGLVVEPYLASVVLCGGLLREVAARQPIAELIAGDMIFAFAHGERQARYALADVATTARRAAGGYVLDGRKTLVLNGDAADTLLVSARTSGASRDARGITLFLVDRDAKGVGVRGYPTNDGLRAAEIDLDGVRLGADAVLGEVDNAMPPIEKVVDQAIAAMVAEAAGIMAALCDLTADYLKTRQQFGRAIGSFQALQHRFVEMLLASEQAKSMAYLAATAWDSNDAASRARTVSAAKAEIGRGGRFVGQQAVQLHGGIGMTDEYSVGHYFKRLTMIDALFGNADHHLARFAETIAAETAAAQ